jgi:hypothetical protein
VCTSNENIANAFVQYYHNLFTTAEPRNISDCLHAIDRKVSPKMNEQPLAAFTEEGVSRSLHQMPPLKALGPDGFSAYFYQQNWATVGREVCSAILSFLNSGHMDAQINATNIALIPKVKNPTHL